MPAPARVATIQALRQLHNPWTTLGEVLAAVRDPLRDPRDRALTTEIVTGTVRWQAAVDHLIAHAAGRPCSAIDIDVLLVLRSAAFQLLFLERVPARAIVSDAVDLVRMLRRSSAAPFANAVLRRLARDGRDPLPARPPLLSQETASVHSPAARAAFLDYAAVTLSHPRWLVSRWLDRYGAELTERWLLFDNQPAVTTIHHNWRRIEPDRLRKSLAAEAVETQLCRYAPQALAVTKGRAMDTEAWRQHWFWIQDEASQLVAWLADVREGSSVLDACAAPGGKTLVLSQRMADRGRLVAGDARPRRLQLLQRTLAQHGVDFAHIVGLDLTRRLPFRQLFDSVVVDAPCSGLGTLRRDPELRWRRQETDLVECASLQRAMLNRAGEVVAPGGQLLYATCSSEPDENARVVEAFLAECPSYSREAATPPLLDPVLFDDLGDLATTPPKHGLEAFYGARLPALHLSATQHDDPSHGSRRVLASLGAL